MDIQPFLNNCTELLVEGFTNTFSERVEGDVRCVDILIFRETLPWVPFYIYFVDRFKGPSKTHKPIKPLSKIDYLIDPKIYDHREDQILLALKQDEIKPEEKNYSQLYEEFHKEDKQIAKWISSCWLEANISKFVEHAYCHHEDQIFKPIDLNTGKELVHLGRLSEIFDG